jgi:hypothetical protein
MPGTIAMPRNASVSPLVTEESRCRPSRGETGLKLTVMAHELGLITVAALGPEWSNLVATIFHR